MRTKIIVSAMRVLCTVALVVSAAGCLIAQPTFRKNRASVVTVNANRLKAHVGMLSQTLHPRDWEHVDNLD